MKRTVSVLLILLSIMISITCQKDEVVDQTSVYNMNEKIESSVNTDSIVGPRNGFVDLIFYRTSLTTDNYLLSQTPNYLRTHTAHNKTKIDSINFIATGNGLINVGGVVLKHYNIIIHYKNKQTPKVLSAFSKSSTDKFTFIPTNSTQLLSNTNNANIVSFEIQKSASVKYNYWFGKTVVLNFVKISNDGIKADQRVLDPLTKDSNIFSLPHLH